MIKYLCIIFIIADAIYSFNQFYTTPLDGDLAGGIVPAEEVKLILEDPFGIKVIFEKKLNPNPNKFFAHYTFYKYFNFTPFIFQKFTTAINSIYLSCALIKLIAQLGFIFMLSLFIGENKLKLFNNDHLLIICLVTPLLQSYGYNGFMGIIDKSSTYLFFYGIPLLLYLVFVYLFLSLKNKKHKTPSILTYTRYILLAILTIILPFSGPLIPPIILISSFLLFIKQFTINQPFKIYKSLINNKLQAIYLLTICLLSFYSIYLGTYNTQNVIEHLPLTERYSHLLNGIPLLFFQKLGFPILFIVLTLNYLILRKLDTKSYKTMLCFYKYTLLFIAIYLFLLPLGGYRSYRPHIIRFDTALPITVLLLFIYGKSTYVIFNQLKQHKKKYLILIFTILFIYTNADRSALNENNCERTALNYIVNSDDEIVYLPFDCSVLEWKPITDPQKSKLNSELLYLWNITADKKLYYTD